MSRIGIITFWTSKDNYGQLLQCWALQQQLKKMNHNPYLIRYYWDPQKTRKNRSLKKIVKVLLIYPILKRLKSGINTLLDSKKIDNLNKKNELRNFDKFRADRLLYSDEEYYSLDQLQRNPPKANYYIAGSDSIWAQLVANSENQSFFLNFGNKETRKISYAASFLMDKYPDNQKTILQSLLKDFYAISVRESNGVHICENVGCNAVQVLDPTLLINKQEYLSLLEIPDNPSNMVYIYSVNIETSEEIRWDNLRRICNRNKYEIKITMGSGMYPGYEIYGSDVNYEYCSVEQWIENINNARLMISASFHGVVFAILMETPFVYIPFEGKKSRLNGRIYDLLGPLGLEDRILTKDRSYESLISSKINWIEVRKKLEIKRKDSIDFLLKNLS